MSLSPYADGLSKRGVEHCHHDNHQRRRHLLFPIVAHMCILSGSADGWLVLVLVLVLVLLTAVAA